MKSILLSIKPEWVCKILNGEKTIEVRKQFPKDYKGWVYIYCKKDRKYANLINRGGFLTGMVVARFWRGNVEEIKYHKLGFYLKEYQHQASWLKDTCLTYDELNNYLGDKTGYAIHISKLEIFDEPRELSEFKKNKKFVSYDYTYTKKYIDWELRPLTKAPQNYCYIEGEE